MYGEEAFSGGEECNLLFPLDDEDEGDEVRGENDREFLFIGEGLTERKFTSYVQQYDFGRIPPDFVVLHHTGIPSARWARYPEQNRFWDSDEDGRSVGRVYDQRLIKLCGIKNFYQHQRKWSRGPHLFIDDRFIWLFSPMSEVGVHAGPGNSYHDASGLHYSIGIEVVGYYEHVRWPPPVARLVGHCIAVLHQRLGTFEITHRKWAGGISSHRNYNKPSCPGAAITEEFYLDTIRQGVARLRSGR